jgi:glycosyltransferase involved in cell wall biosynthesis
MKIGFDAKRAFHNETGLGNYSRTLITGMMRQHPEHEYLLMDTGKPLDLPYFNRQLKDSGARWNYLSGGMLGKFSRSFGWGRKCIQAGLDVFHGLSNELPFDWKPGKVKSIVTIHDVIFRRFPEAYKPLDIWIYNKKTSYAAKYADVILATSEQTKSDLEQWFPASSGKIVVIYQDADPAFHYRKRPEAVAKILYKFDLVEKPYILCVSKLEKRKNHLKLLQAFKKIMHQIPDDLVLVGGRGDTADEILDQLGDFEGRLRWLGKVETDELVNLYDGSSFTVYPSVFEGFGIPLLESMRRGKAIVSSKGSCFEEIAGAAAIYADPESSDEMAAQMLRLANNPDFKKSIEKEAPLECSRFEPKMLIEKVYQLYK